MVRLRKSKERGFADHGWLTSWHTFSFASYLDRKHMGFRSLRVINEDQIQGGGGFGSHPHQDMEILSYVVRGALRHRDSMGNTMVIRPGEVQRMSAGTGVVHSEHNDSATETTHLLQIWIRPESHGGEPRYDQKSFAQDLARGKPVLVASKDGRSGSIQIQQDADVFIGQAPVGESFQHALRPGRGLWLQLIRGRLRLNRLELEAGDGVALEDEAALEAETLESCEFIFFDLA